MESAVRAYYEAIDADDYDRLASLLAPEFEHDRSDRTLAGREAFVSFMREDRPQKDTVHELCAVYRVADGGRERGEWAARGRLFGPDGDRLFEFVDVFAVGDDERFARLTTFTR